MKKIDKRKITRKSIENNIVGETFDGYYVVVIDGVKMIAKYWEENRYDIYPRSRKKDDPDANMICVHFVVDGDIFNTPDKIIRF